MPQLEAHEEPWSLVVPRAVEQWSEPLVIRNLLCAVDFTEFSYRAFQFAAAIARHFQAHLFVQHIVSLPPEVSWSTAGTGLVKERLRGARRIAEEELRRLQSEADIEDMNVTYMLNDGDVQPQILETVGRRKIDLLVLGTHARKGIKRLVEGSLAERLVHEAVCPVLVVSRPQKELRLREEPDSLSLRTILLATDFSRNSDRALTYALRWAAEWSGRVILLHTVETSSKAAQPFTDLLPEADSNLENRVRDAWEKVRMLIPDPSHTHCQIEYDVRDGDPREQILDCAAEKKADLIVMGARGLGKSSLASSLYWGSTLSGVIRDGRFPVLALRHLCG
ncbi:MAG: universal stress protein [Acidobacteria bacterium]|nr:universal stress protein [Acidobacteriota bacterium]